MAPRPRTWIVVCVAAASVLAAQASVTAQSHPDGYHTHVRIEATNQRAAAFAEVTIRVASTHQRVAHVRANANGEAIAVLQAWVKKKP